MGENGRGQPHTINRGLERDENVLSREKLLPHMGGREAERPPTAVSFLNFLACRKETHVLAFHASILAFTTSKGHSRSDPGVLDDPLGED